MTTESLNHHCHHLRSRSGASRDPRRSLTGRFRSRGSLAVAALVVAGLSLAGCGAGSQGKQQSTANVANEVLAAYFPTDSADWHEGENLQAFEQAVAAKVADPCITHDGFPAPRPQPFTYSPNNEEFPDLAEIKQSGRFVTAQAVHFPDPTRGMSASEKAAYDAAAARCTRNGLAAFGSMIRIGTGPLGQEWLDTVFRIDATSQAQRDLARFVTCVNAGGVKATNISTFFQYVDTQTIPLTERGQQVQASAVNRRLAALYVRCITPLEEYRDAQRARARAAFFASHAEQIDALRSAANRVIVRLVRKYDVAPLRPR